MLRMIVFVMVMLKTRVHSLGKCRWRTMSFEQKPTSRKWRWKNLLERSGEELAKQAVCNRILT